MMYLPYKAQRCFVALGAVIIGIFLPAIEGAAADDAVQQQAEKQATPNEKSVDEPDSHIDKIASPQGHHVAENLQTSTSVEDKKSKDVDQRLQQVIEKALQQGLITSTEESSTTTSPSVKIPLPTEGTEKKSTPSKLRSGSVVVNAPCIDGIYKLPGVIDSTASFDTVNSLRGELLTNEGKYDPETILELSKLYLSLGMAEEAKSLGQLAPTVETKLITEMADIILENPLSENATLNQKSKCGEHAIIWSALADLDLQPEENLQILYDNIDIIKKFSPWLAQILHKKIIYKSLMHDRMDIALEFSRITQKDTLYSTYINALIKAAQGDDLGVATLSAIAQKPSLYKDDAVIWISRFQKARPTEKYPEILDELEDLSVIKKSKEVENNLLQLRMQSLLEKRHYGPLLNILREREMVPADKDRFENLFIEQLTRDLTDSDPLKKARALSVLFSKRPISQTYWQKAELQPSFLKAAQSLNLPTVLSKIVQDFDKEQLQVMNSPEILWAEYDARKAPPIHEIHSTVSSDPRVLTIWVNNLRRDQRYAEAIKLLEAKIKSAPPERQSELVVMLASTAWEAGNWSVAARALTEVIKTDSSDTHQMRLLMAKYMLGVSSVTNQNEWIAFQDDISIGIDRATTTYLLETTAQEIKLLEQVLDNG